MPSLIDKLDEFWREDSIKIPYELLMILSSFSLFIALLIVITKFYSYIFEGRSKMAKHYHKPTKYQIFMFAFSLLLTIIFFACSYLRYKAVENNKVEALFSLIISSASMLVLSLVWSPFLSTMKSASGFFLIAYFPLFVIYASLMAEVGYRYNRIVTAEFVIMTIATPCVVIYLLLLLCFPLHCCRYRSDSKEIWPESKVNLCSRMNFLWLYNVVWKSWHKGVNVKTVFTLGKDNNPKQITHRLMRRWQNHSLKSESHWSLWIFIFKAFSRQILIHICIRLVTVLSSFSFPLLVKLYLYTTDDVTGIKGKWQTPTVFLGILLFFLIESYANNHYFHYGYQIQKQFIFGLTKLLYSKVLSVSSAARSTEAAEKVLNFVSNDIPAVTTFFLYFPMLLWTPLELGGSIYIIYESIGWAIFVGFGVMVVLIIVTLFIAYMSKSYVTKQSKEQDRRIKAITDMILGIKIIKFFAWEEHFRTIISAIRKVEVYFLKTEAIYYNIMTNLWNFSSIALIIVSMFTFIYGVNKNNPNSFQSKDFIVSLFLLNLIRVPISLFPLIISSLILTINSSKRLVKFLLMTERDSSTHLEYVLGESPTAIVLQNCRFAWSKEPNGFVLDIERLEIPSGQLVGIYGKVGSGKTSLLSSMLGEMISIEPEKENFKAKINKSIGYVSQSAWIQSRNVKQNILFFNEFDKPFYENVVHCTALEEDFKMLASGDSTQIGEKGINLSGGQKQRIALARAVYAKKELYILDDPLSAVDIHVSKHIFKKVVSNKGILNNTTRLFVTNNPIFLAKCDRVLIIEEGKIIADDKYENLTSQYDFFSEQNTLEAQHGDETPSPNVHEITPTSILHSTTGQQSKHFIQNQLRRMTNADSVAEESLYSDDIGAKKTADDFFTGERVQLGLVKLSDLTTYFKNYGKITLIVIVLSFLLSVALQTYSNYSFYRFIIQTDQRVTDNTQVWSDAKKNLWLFLGLGVGFLILSAIFYSTITYGAIKASRNIHSSLLDRLLHWPLSQFEKTPAGRIINKFSKDLFTLDFSIPRSLHLIMLTMIGILSSYVEIVVIELYFIFAVALMSLLSFFAQRLYVSASRQYGRLEIVSRSPILNQFLESFQGSSTIFAMNKEGNMIDHFDSLIAAQSSYWIPWMCVNRWIGIVFDQMSLIAIFIYLLIITFTSQKNSTKVSYLLANIKKIASIYVWCARMAGDFELNFVSMERINELKSAPQEPEWYVKDFDDVLENWPSEGTIHFDKFYLKYRPNLNYALADIDFKIPGGTKVGIVGRTGAGKSTLISALFRTIESSSGAITIDNVNISHIGLQQLRQKLSLIPQDPVIFDNTLRHNLDPEERYSDEEIWKCLKLCNLDDLFFNSPLGLFTQCTESSFSLGQMQLLCMVRALLRKSKILLLDEATASVDMETDKTIQKTIREEFKNTTILAIAHRLQTVIDYDIILVLSAGRIAESGTPSELISKRGIFYDMCKEANLVDTISSLK